MKAWVVEVAVGGPARSLDRLFSYRVPSHLVEQIQVGSCVQVPFAKEVCQGFVCRIGTFPTPLPEGYREVAGVLDSQPLLTPELLELAQFMAAHYFYPVSRALGAMLPAPIRGTLERWLCLPEHPPAASLLGLAAEPLLQHLHQKRRGAIKRKEALTWPGVDAELLESLVREGILCWQDRFSTVREQQWVLYHPEALRCQAERLRGNATRQQAILTSLLAVAEDEAEQALPLQELWEQVGPSWAALRSLQTAGCLQLAAHPGRHAAGKERAPHLTSQQAAAWERLEVLLQSERYAPTLIEGITGSGKTELYMRAIAHALAQGKAALLLVPEIALTLQTVQRLQRRFGSRTVVLHSRLTASERYTIWQQVRQGQVDILVGARSAIFAPFATLGVIILDEEHEPAYRQAEYPPYDALQLAHVRAQNHQCPLLLGSATPSLTSYFLARQERYHHLVLTERAAGYALPSVEAVDMRLELAAGHRQIISRALLAALESCQAAGEQAMLFLNRRGFSTCAFCRVCGEALRCEHCDVSLTYHQVPQQLRCHYCNYQTHLPSVCPACQEPALRYLGTGTQQVETFLRTAFPTWRIARMDVDTTRQQGAQERILQAFADRELDVLVGTQMIAKGLDFPGLTLVGVVLADSSLHLPHFRAAERTFQLLVQVSGRAGRHQPGKALIQSYCPEHYSIQAAVQQQDHSFYEQELAFRRAHHYPPFGLLATLLLSHPDRDQLWQQAEVWKERGLASLREPYFEIWGPVPAGVPRVRDQHRLQMVIKGRSDAVQYEELRCCLRALLMERRDPRLQVRTMIEGTELVVGGIGDARSSDRAQPGCHSAAES